MKKNISLDDNSNLINDNKNNKIKLFLIILQKK